ncbi:hypothetical protein MKZ38_005912 [Zalerion maritima]|uniref:Ankyrin repeat protein n=1 Tax=Zalerion maritima TaxID=339359 RepID=A0AAD5RKE1_9PEZI|nr:hypothetical protein MKZ38_005912 [Zalerion maritima]
MVWLGVFWCFGVYIAHPWTSLIGASFKISCALINLQGRFQRVPKTVTALDTELKATSLGLGQFEQLLSSRQDAFSTGGDGEDERRRVVQCLDAIVFNMAGTFSLIENELEKLQKSESLQGLAFRMRFMWAEGDLTSYMELIRDWRSSLLFVAQSLQFLPIKPASVMLPIKKASKLPSRRRPVGKTLPQGALDERIGTDLPPVIAASYAGHTNMVRMLLDAGANSRLQGPGGNTSLFWAASRGHLQVVELILSRGCRHDVNLPNSTNLTPLMGASQHGRHEIVKLLLCKTVTLLFTVLPPSFVNQVTSNGKTALIFASISRHYSTVEALLERDALPNLQDGEGKTALYHAAEKGYSEVASLLLSRKANPENLHEGRGTGASYSQRKGARASRRLSPFFGRASVCRTILGRPHCRRHRHTGRAKGDPRAIDPLPDEPGSSDLPAGSCSLQRGARLGLLETIDALLGTGVDINGHVSGGAFGTSQTPLMRAVRESSLEAVKSLIAKGGFGDYSRRPWSNAASSGSQEL